MKFNTHIIIAIASVTGLINSANAGVVISSTQNNITEISIYQKGIAVHLNNGKADSIIDTNTDNCIAINHELKRYLFVKCDQFKLVVKWINRNKQKQLNKKIPIAVQELMSGNLPPRTPISIKRSGRGSYQGYNVEKYQFIVDDEVVSEYWMSGILEEKISKEIDMSKLNSIFEKNRTNKNFSDGLDSKISNKYNEFKNNRFALKEFRYTGSETKKIYRYVTIKRVKIRKYMPPNSYKISTTIKDYFSTEP